MWPALKSFGYSISAALTNSPAPPWSSQVFGVPLLSCSWSEYDIFVVPAATTEPGTLATVGFGYVPVKPPPAAQPENTLHSASAATFPLTSVTMAELMGHVPVVRWLTPPPSRSPAHWSCAVPSNAMVVPIEVCAACVDRPVPLAIMVCAAMVGSCASDIVPLRLANDGCAMETAPADDTAVTKLLVAPACVWTPWVTTPAWLLHVQFSPVESAQHASFVAAGAAGAAASPKVANKEASFHPKFAGSLASSALALKNPIPPGLAATFAAATVPTSSVPDGATRLELSNVSEHVTAGDDGEQMSGAEPVTLVTVPVPHATLIGRKLPDASTAAQRVPVPAMSLTWSAPTLNSMKPAPFSSSCQSLAASAVELTRNTVATRV